MSKNIDQIFVANPASSMVSTDLFYLGRSPYGASNDMAITWANVLASIPTISSINQNTSSTTLASNSRYITNNGASLVTYTLPATAAIGDTYVIVGSSSGGWTVAQNSGQICHHGSSATTSGTGGSLASSNQYDCITITCVVANTTFVVYGVQGNITIV